MLEANQTALVTFVAFIAFLGFAIRLARVFFLFGGNNGIGRSLTTSDYQYLFLSKRIRDNVWKSA